MLLYNIILSRHEYNGWGHGCVVVLLPGFAINWKQNHVTRQLHLHDWTHIIIWLSPFGCHINWDILVLTHWGRVMHICVSKLTIIDSENGLSPGRRQAIIWTNAGVNKTLRNKLQWNINWNSNIFINKNAFESVFCEMASILSLPQCVNISHCLSLRICRRRWRRTSPQSSVLYLTWPWTPSNSTSMLVAMGSRRHSLINHPSYSPCDTHFLCTHRRQILSSRRLYRRRRLKVGPPYGSPHVESTVILLWFLSVTVTILSLFIFACYIVWKE